MKRLVFTVLLIATLFFTMSAEANDATYYTKGNHLVPLQETSISIRRELLTISLMDNGYARVDVQYEFWNPENTVRRLLMGFEADPPYNFDYKFHPDGRHPSISSFTVEMNGSALPYSNAACVADTNVMVPIDTTKPYFVYDNNRLYEDDGKGTWEPSDYESGIPYAYVYYFEAEFQPGLNRVRHSYVYRMSTGVGTPFMVEYKLTPAARWAGGQIDDFTLVIRVDNTAKHFFVFDSVFAGAALTVSEGMCKMRRPEHYGNPTEVSLRNGAITLHKTGFSPQSELYINAVGIEGVYVGNNCIAGGTYDRSGRIDWGPYEGMQEVPNEAAFHQRVMRPLPYAHRGHVVKDKSSRPISKTCGGTCPTPTIKTTPVTSPRSTGNLLTIKKNDYGRTHSQHSQQRGVPANAYGGAYSEPDNGKDVWLSAIAQRTYRTEEEQMRLSFGCLPYRGTGARNRTPCERGHRSRTGGDLRVRPPRRGATRSGFRQTAQRRQRDIAPRPHWRLRPLRLRWHPCEEHR